MTEKPQSGNRHTWLIAVVILGLLLSCLFGALMGAFTGYLAGRSAAESHIERMPSPPGLDPWRDVEPREPYVPLPDTAAGALVVEVEPDSPAEEAGLHPGDVIIAVDGLPLRPGESLAERINTYNPGEVIELQIMRAGRERSLTAQLGRHPDMRTRPRLGITYRDLPGRLNGR